MNRRSFLSMMGYVAPAVIVKPTYFFAPKDGWGIKMYATIGAWADYPLGPHGLIGDWVSYNFRYTAMRMFSPSLEVDSVNVLQPNGGCDDDRP